MCFMLLPSYKDIGRRFDGRLARNAEVLRPGSKPSRRLHAEAVPVR